MKKLILIGTFLVTFLLGTGMVNASATLTVSKNKIEVGQSVTATVKVTGASAVVTITSSGATNGCSQKFLHDDLDAKNSTRSFSVTCKATGTGIIGFTLTGNVTNANDGVSKNVSGSQSVTVVAVTPKSNVNYLKDLSIEGFELTPEFDKKTLEYSVTVPNDTKKVNITATKEHAKASVKGAGEIEVEEGLNTIEIIVSAENGSERQYIVNVTVAELDPILVTVDGKEYTVVRKVDELPEISSSFSSTTVKINGEEVPAYYSELINLTVVALRNNDGEVKLFIYDINKNEYKPFNELNISGIHFLPLDAKNIPKGYKETTITISGVKLKVYRYKNSDFYLIYGINSETGNEGWFSYDKKENTVQRYNNELNKQSQIYLYTAIGLAGTIVLLLLLLIKVASKKAKKIKTILENTQILAVDKKNKE